MYMKFENFWQAQQFRAVRRPPPALASSAGVCLCARVCMCVHVCACASVRVCLYNVCVRERECVCANVL